MTEPARGEVWLADLDPTIGREHAGKRPVLVLSEDTFNRGPADLVVVLPMTTREKRIPSHVPLRSPEGGVRVDSFVICEAVRSISKQRLASRWGVVSPSTLRVVEDTLRILLGL